MLASRSASFLNRMMTPQSVRMFSAAGIKSRFEEAYAEKQASKASRGPAV